MPTLFTVDGRSLTPEALEAQATGAGVSTVADVRTETLRDSGLSPDRLAERLEGAGVGYVRLESLATATAGPDAAEDYAVLRGLALDEDVCVLGDGSEAVLAERLATETGLPVVRLRA